MLWGFGFRFKGALGFGFSLYNESGFRRLYSSKVKTANSVSIDQHAPLSEKVYFGSKISECRPLKPAGTPVRQLRGCLLHCKSRNGQEGWRLKGMDEGERFILCQFVGLEMWVQRLEQ